MEHEKEKTWHRLNKQKPEKQRSEQLSHQRRYTDEHPYENMLHVICDQGNATTTHYYMSMRMNLE